MAGLSVEAEAEIQYLEAMIARLEAGEEDPEDFRVYRLKNGIYGIRGRPEHHMIRIKLPVGRISLEGLRVLAEVAERYTENRLAHVTTRQAVQLHHVHRRDVPKVLRAVNAVGLTTREACGHSIRAITCCPYAGVSPEAPFDVTPYAEATYRYFLRHPVGQNLPRKFKIAFEGCPTDHARTPIHDIGAVAAVEGGKRGFRLYVGGGLGAAPMSAELLEPFTPEEDLLPTMLAIIRLFDRYGNRKVLTQARLKFLVKKWGIAAFREAVREERRLVKLTASGEDLKAWAPPPEPEPPRLPTPPRKPFSFAPGFDEWRRTNLYPQKQAGFYTVAVRLPLGDITPEGLRALAEIAEVYAGEVRSAISQNFLLRYVPEEALGGLYEALLQAGLAQPQAHTLLDITRCPGADTCNLAITHSRGLAQALEAHLASLALVQDPMVRPISIKISGCPNSCGQHHIADIGFYGSSRKVGEREVPHYTLLLGGRTREGEARFGQVVARIPARRTPEAVERILKRYQEEREQGESFQAYLDRVGAASFKPLLEDLQTIPSYEEAPEYYQDLGAEGETFRVQLGRGECAV
ncbi:nitrite/sulfite reductase [Thermus scotoductus]|uniref:Ferredoxin--nitrite reductase n=7 Tax=Thermus scotoductus TaxID=37636 RepID=A0A0N1KQ29_THESC|nr:nitrite/sulfite reductase [Thermus scotoductus]KPD32323.1 ferredoxin--nitrite reductase [Thermus scotoductus]RTG94692.1 ferredoxin--nitrite reductase [Thermus scotoductus]RTH01899.1 ferredoxin--nitrite reductase [Thermus scotoductus]RTH98944.1 ferredoxin--nitrite reductase [Thermus scotoductus]RTI28180.1 ferredoxin--nitrite reductase [Thermus scotoductus]